MSRRSVLPSGWARCRCPPPRSYSSTAFRAPWRGGAVSLARRCRSRSSDWSTPPSTPRSSSCCSATPPPRWCRERRGVVRRGHRLLRDELVHDVLERDRRQAQLAPLRRLSRVRNAGGDRDDHHAGRARAVPARVAAKVIAILSASGEHLADPLVAEGGGSTARPGAPTVLTRVIRRATSTERPAQASTTTTYNYPHVERPQPGRCRYRRRAQRKPVAASGAHVTRSSRAQQRPAHV